MASHQPPLPPSQVLLGPGGVPLAQSSNLRCPRCGDEPPLSVNPEMPVGVPVSIMSVIPGEQIPTFGCLKCWNTFYAKFIRRHAPTLQPKVDGVRYIDPENAATPEEKGLD